MKEPFRENEIGRGVEAGVLTRQIVFGEERSGVISSRKAKRSAGEDTRRYNAAAFRG